ncbi:LamG domain-containing protein, partial [Patescibacteria group bacterium]|nr:LamG domain-containing protein [Patescibacteria group bacterium]
VSSDGSTGQMTVNGVFETLNLISGTNNGDWFGDMILSTPTRITTGGLFYQGAMIEFVDGLIDNVRIYETALSEAQIQKLYAEGAVKHNLAIE